MAEPGDGTGSTRPLAPTTASGGTRGVCRSGLSRPIRVLLIIAVSSTALVALEHYLANPIRVHGTSMEPTLRSGDVVLVSRVAYAFSSPSRGDIVTVRPGRRGSLAKLPEGANVPVFVKRIVGMPGEWIMARLGVLTVCKRLHSACERLRENYVGTVRADFGPFHIAARHYFVLGDNRAVSDDSRDWGPVRANEITARVFAVAWPLRHVHLH